VKAPSVAEYLAQAILNHSRDDSQSEAHSSNDCGSGTNAKRPSKRRKQLDRTYRLPKSSRTQPDISRDEAEDSDTAVEGRSPVGDDSVTCQPCHTINQTSDSLTTEKPQPLQECEGDIPEIVVEQVPQEAVQGQSAARSRTTGTEPALHLLKATCSSDSAMRDAAHKQPSVAITLDGSTEDSQTTCIPPFLINAEQRETALPEINGKASDAQAPSAPSLSHGTKPHETALSGPTPSTPVRQIGRGFQSPLSDQTAITNTALFTPTINGEVLSPLTEDDRTASPPDKVEVASLEGIPSSPSSMAEQQIRLNNMASTQAQRVDGEQSLSIQDRQTMLPSSLFGEAPTLTDMVAKAVHLMYKMSRRQEVPTKIHSRILGTLQPSLGESPASTAVAERGDSIWNTSSSTSWSASMWINMLEAGQARSREATILNMIEWMGASEWYDAELAQVEKAPPLTKRGKLRKRLATVVLDEYLKEAQDTTAIGSPGKLVSGDNEDRPPSINSTGIQKRILDARRKKLNNIFNRGRTLRKLIQMTHLGILFDPDI
jgi:hypothetical protein